MIEIGRPDLRAYISEYMFSVIGDDIRYQVVWRQNIARNGEVMGDGHFNLVKTSYRQSRIWKLREDYLRRIKKDA